MSQRVTPSQQIPDHPLVLHLPVPKLSSDWRTSSGGLEAVSQEILS
ncbi:MAG: hypothetical protein M3O33_13780 [Cyanobacteriota bacterium]|nr:hypothetical protein [Cyanobacteriota bacterium]